MPNLRTPRNCAPFAGVRRRADPPRSSDNGVVEVPYEISEKLSEKSENEGGAVTTRSLAPDGMSF